MKSKAFVFVFLLAGLIVLANFVQAPKPWRGIVIGLPAEVNGTPGESVTINGTVLNVGWYWLHEFNISVKGLPDNYEVTVEPKMFENLRILRDWNPVQGLYLVPEKFWIYVKVPQDAVGVHLVNVTGKEWTSWRKFENSTSFLFTVSTPPKVALSDIVVPDQVTEFKPFDIKFDANNGGASDQIISLRMVVPADWTVDPKEKNLTLKANSSEPVTFTITPTNTSGEISVFMEYPYRAVVLNMTKTGPFITPAAAPAPGIELPTALVAALNFVKANTVVSLIAALLLLVILWNLWQIAKHYKFKKTRGKPEEMLEPNTTVNPV